MNRIITHANCPDGIMSALILARVFPDAKVEFVDYTQLRALEPAPYTIFADIAPSTRLDEWRAEGAVVLDHHHTAKEVTTSFRHHLYADAQARPGVSGALLALEYATEAGPSWPYYADEFIRWRRYAELVGIRDTWQRASHDWKNACELSAALMFWGFERLRLSFTQHRLSVGSVLLENRAREVEKAVETGFRFEIQLGGAPVRVLAFEGAGLTSDAPDVAKDVDVVVGWHIERDQTIYSMRSRGHVDVSEIAKRNGGGGHKAAAGFTISNVDVAGAPPLVEDVSRGTPIARWFRAVSEP